MNSAALSVFKYLPVNGVDGEKTMEVEQRSPFPEYDNDKKWFVLERGHSTFRDDLGNLHNVNQLRFSYSLKISNGNLLPKPGVPVIPIRDAHSVAIKMGGVSRCDKYSVDVCEIDKTIPHAPTGSFNHGLEVYSHEFEKVVVLKSLVFYDLRIDIRRARSLHADNLGKKFIKVSTKKHLKSGKWQWINTRPYIPVVDIPSVMAVVMSLSKSY